MAKTKGGNLCAMQLWRQIRGNTYFREPLTFSRLICGIENRPGGPHIYDRQIRRALLRDDLKPARLKAIINRIGGKNEIQTIVRELAGGVADFSDRTPLTNLELIRSVLRAGLCRDTNKIRLWIANENQKLGLFFHNSLKPLELVIYHAHSEIDELYDLTVRRGLRPAAIVSSGSGEMVNDVCDKEWFQKELEIIQWSRSQEVPYFGICFGQQALGYQAFGVMPVYHKIPEGVTHERHSDKSLLVTPGVKRMIYGSRMITANPFNPKLHPVMKGVSQVECLEAHSMGFELGGGTSTIPLDKIQAVSLDHFYNVNGPTAEITRLIVEVIADGYAVGVQPHPELTAQVLILLLELPRLAEALVAEGQDLESMRADLRRYCPNKYSAGERLGYNFFKFVMAPNLIAWLHDAGLISADLARQMLEQRFGGMSV